MTLYINSHTRLREIQENFQEAYPMLKLEFFDQPHSWGEGSSRAHRYASSFRIQDILHRNFTNALITIKAWHKAGEVEAAFAQHQLYVQVYRRYHDGWIQTAGTDDLTLFEQNEIGKKSAAEQHDNLWIERTLFF